MKGAHVKFAPGASAFVGKGAERDYAVEVGRCRLTLVPGLLCSKDLNLWYRPTFGQITKTHMTFDRLPNSNCTTSSTKY